jgi:hypothetical protein
MFCALVSAASILYYYPSVFNVPGDITFESIFQPYGSGAQNHVKYQQPSFYPLAENQIYAKSEDK